MLPLHSLKIPIQYLEILERLVRTSGGDTSAIKQAASLTADAESDQHFLLSGVQFQRAIQVAARYCTPGRSRVSQFIEHIPLTPHGPMGMLAAASRTVGDATFTAERYLHLIFPPYSVTVLKDPIYTHLKFTRISNFGDMDDLLTEVVVRTILSAQPFMMEHFSGVHLRFRHAEQSLDYIEPGGNVKSVSYEAEQDEILIPTSQMSINLKAPQEWPTKQDEPDIDLRVHAGQQYRPFTDMAVRIINEGLACGSHCNGKSIAQDMRLSMRTLTRKLAPEGSSVLELILSSRMAFAENMLASSSASVTDIAQRAGYTKVSNFSRAFKRVHGNSPYEFRQKVGSRL